jgi:hypothetical protein
MNRLHAYFERYRPMPRAEVERAVAQRSEPNLSARTLSSLIEFIYREIEYQRRESIRTMVSYCTQDEKTPERLRAAIRSYFDRSEAFSDGLAAMAKQRISFDPVIELLDKAKRVDDAEQLYWETRRLLDERFRADWATANLFAMLFRQRGAVSDSTLQLFADIVASLEDEFNDISIVLDYLGALFRYITRLDRAFGEGVAGSILGDFVVWLYREKGSEYRRVITKFDRQTDVRDHLTLQIATMQLEEMTYAQYSRAIG